MPRLVDVEYNDGTKGTFEVPTEKEHKAFEADMKKLLREVLPLLGIDPETGMEFEK